MLKLEKLNDEQVAVGFCKMIMDDITDDYGELNYLAWIILDKTIQDMGGRIRIDHFRETFAKLKDNLSTIEGMYHLKREKAMLKTIEDIIQTYLATNEEIWDNRDYRTVMYSNTEGVEEDIQDLFTKGIYPIKEVFINYKTTADRMFFVTMRELSTRAVIMGPDAFITRTLYNQLLDSEMTSPYCWNYLYDVIKREHKKYLKNEKSLLRKIEKVEYDALDDLAPYLETITEEDLELTDLTGFAELVGSDIEDEEEAVNGKDYFEEDEEDEEAYSERTYWDA